MNNATIELAEELRELGGFVQLVFLLLMMTNRVRHMVQTLLTLLEHIMTQLDILSLGHLSPSVVTPNHLREVLLRIQTELPHHLRLPLDPTEGLWKYYISLGCVTLLEGSKLLVVTSLPLLDRNGLFEIYQVLNLPIPYPRVQERVEAVAKYQIKTEYLAHNLARTKFMLLTRDEARNCKGDVLGRLQVRFM